MSKKVHVQTKINGQDVEFLCEPRQSLLECLRDIVGLTGTKEGCNDGNCGACTIILEGRTVTSCLVLGVEVDGKELTTIEGIADGDKLHPIQTAFLENAALQCGICTPGFIIATKALLDKNPFSDSPPQYIRAILYDYRFTTKDEKKQTGAWWKRKRLKEYSPNLKIREE